MKYLKSLIVKSVILITLFLSIAPINSYANEQVDSNIEETIHLEDNEEHHTDTSPLILSL